MSRAKIGPITTPSEPPMKHRRKLSPPAALPILLGVACATLCLTPSGCGYHVSGSPENATGGYQWSTLYRGDVGTIAVPIFQNKTFYRGYEFNLTKAVVSRVQAQTPYRVVSKERADSILEGEIDNVRFRTVSDDPRTSLPQEQLLEVTVRFTWKDLRNGRILVDRHDFRQSATFYPTLGEGRFVGEQDNLERLARAIVQELQADW